MQIWWHYYPFYKSLNTTSCIWNECQGPLWGLSSSARTGHCPPLQPQPSLAAFSPLFAGLFIVHEQDGSLYIPTPQCACPSYSLLPDLLFLLSSHIAASVHPSGLGWRVTFFREDSSNDPIHVVSLPLLTSHQLFSLGSVSSVALTAIHIYHCVHLVAYCLILLCRKLIRVGKNAFLLYA